MTLAAHSLAGAVIGKYAGNIWLIIILSVVLHFILDAFRHGEYLNGKSSAKESFWKAAIDLIVGGVIILILIKIKGAPPSVQINMFTGAFFSVLPDFFTLLYWKLGMKFLKPLYELHVWIHKHPPFSPERKWGLKNAANDIVISLIAVILLLF